MKVTTIVKKILTTSALLILLLSLTACNKKGGNSESEGIITPTLTPTLTPVLTPTSPVIDTRFLETQSKELKVDQNILYWNTNNYLGDDVELMLDVYSLNEDTIQDRPAILLVHGGGLTKGDKQTDSLIQNMSMDYAKMGYVTFNVNYRLREAASDMALYDAMQDIIAAFNWIQKNCADYGVNPNKIALAGYSSGATIVTNLYYSNSDMFDMNRSSVFAVIDIAGNDLYLNTPIPENAGCLIIHGTKDSVAEYELSENLYNTLLEYNVYADMLSLEGINHDVKSKYDLIRNRITEFLYLQLTGNEVVVTTQSEIPMEYQNVMYRQENSPIYKVPRISIVMDGDLSDWNDNEIISLNQLKDAGTSLPNSDDFFGTAMIGWMEETPSIIYIAARITDDEIQDIFYADSKWYNDDCLEIVFDLSEANVAEQLIKWVVGANGNDFTMMATKENMQVCLKREGNTTNYEIAIDLAKIDPSVRDSKTVFSIYEDMTIGFSISYNDGENQVREHQIGWTAGKSSDRTTLGNLNFQ